MSMPRDSAIEDQGTEEGKVFMGKNSENDTHRFVFV